MGQALYRKYRPRTLKDVAGQEHITHTLEQALKSGRISHAYLFTGPRGVGKTSIARIMAHEINGLEYDENSSHVDIIEIDAASNRRIDDARELREKVYIAPSSAKYKVYIIDEVHMLTKEAFNALLKTLEEPPEHVVFILATTDVHKLPPTIISRTQRYAFRPISQEDMANKLKEVADKEKIDITEEALKVLSEHAQGSLRDGESLLDQARSRGGNITEETVIDLIGIPPTSILNELLDASLKSSDINRVASILNSLNEQGYQADNIAKQLFVILRNRMLSESDINHSQALDLMADLIEVPASSDPERYIEVALIKAQPRITVSKAVVTEPKHEVKEAIEKPVPIEAEPNKPAPKEDAKEETAPAAPEKEATKTKPAPVGNNEIDEALWGKVLTTMKKDHSTLYGTARMAVAEFSGGSLKLSFAHEFHRKKVNESSNMQKIMEIISSLTGKDMAIECVLNKSVSAPQPKVDVPAPKEEGDGLAAISNIFNGAELLES